MIRRRLDAWLDHLDATDLPDGLRQEAAQQLRRLASAIWDGWKLDEVRYLHPYDLTVIRVVGVIDRLAHRLDPPW